jgi:hypothetical protein
MSQLTKPNNTMLNKQKFLGSHNVHGVNLIENVDRRIAKAADLGNTRLIEQLFAEKAEISKTYDVK